MSGIPVVAVRVEEPALRDRVAAALAADGLTAEADARAGQAADVAVLATRRRGPRTEEVPDLGGATKAVVLAADPSERLVRRAVAAGAAGVLSDEAVEAGLAACVRAVWAGLRCVPLERPRAAVRPALTVREKQILGMVVLGLSNMEIAGRLHVTESTVKSHLSATFGKLGVNSRSEAAAAVLDPATGLGAGILHIVGSE